MTEMSQREKVLSWIVGGVMFFVLNIFAVKFLMDNYRKLTTTRAEVEGKIAGLRLQESQRDLWAQRDLWLNNSLTAMGDSDVANRQLIAAVQGVAKKHTVTLEAPQPGVPLRQQLYTVLSIKLEAKAAWTQMFDFMQELQAPGQFISVEGELKVDPTDKTQLRAALTVSKWYSPDAKP
jgi:hypothetical protein